MDGIAAREDEKRMLKRIVALLFFFVWTARLSCALPGSARAFVLRTLRKAFVVAYDFVADTAWAAGAPPLEPLALNDLYGGDTPADALRLARDFRELAQLLKTLTEIHAEPFARAATALDALVRRPVEAFRQAIANARGLFRQAPAQPDTS